MYIHCIATVHGITNSHHFITTVTIEYNYRYVATYLIINFVCMCSYVATYLRSYMQENKHTHTHMHTHIHTHAHTYTHRYIYTYTHMYMHWNFNRI